MAAGSYTLFACAGVVQVWMIMSRDGGLVLQSEAGGGASGRHRGLVFSSWCADFHSPESEKKSQREEKFYSP